MYKNDHTALQDGTFQYNDTYREYLDEILQSSVIELVIGKVGTDTDKKRLNWVYHVLAVCDAHEREVNKRIEVRGKVTLPQWATDNPKTLAAHADETRLLIF